ncbi:GntR family transcriptional regulator [Paucibacter sp. DJ2R-2]|uniref:GntR family transcriptional regulator n=1 Tax=Paucibacter sp. DJ2R-2 TaxID=2893558 RepID=UPI0021E4AFBE|nr:GntR family transcriptional regulator [Paucibacter sp. DJ2R-2]MCV2422885.1 GntR family transcriptional regulator [Paucibacter sp. DJ4R-1]MCV2440781.1 GntR family transcriptional regulator [Paucibacter sp. DJ2R-2]
MPAEPRSIKPSPALGTAAPALPLAHALAHRALYQEVAEHLRQQIFSRQLEPGAWIDELKLCGELGISRTPMREALKVLAVEGLVTMKLRRGAYVTEMSERDVREAYQLLALLESDAAARVAAQGSEADLAELQALHEELERQVAERDAFFAANERFHLRMLEIEANRWRQQIVTDLRRVMKLNRHHSLFKQGRLQDSLKEHRMLMKALRERHADEAARLMRAHFDNGLAAATQA